MYQINNLGKVESRLGIGPMSSETIEATYRYSELHQKELMLIASKNQIDYAGGYVNGWTTAQYAEFLQTMRVKYPKSRVLICRDHCGPGFNGNYDLEDTYATIKSDIENGFDLIHIDFCHFQGTKEEQLEASKKAVEYALELNPNILLEIGTDENLGTNYSDEDIKNIEADVDFFQKFCKPEFYVVQTGSLIKEMNQRGAFSKDFIQKISSLLESKGIKLKEHNADYLDKKSIDLRSGMTGAMNIAPQFGVVQTQLVLGKGLIYGVPLDHFIEEVYHSKKWGKWLDKNTPENKYLCATIAGHYLFNSESYKEIEKQLAEREDIKEFLINELMKIIHHYEQ